MGEVTETAREKGDASRTASTVEAGASKASSESFPPCVKVHVPPVGNELFDRFLRGVRERDPSSRAERVGICIDEKVLGSHTRGEIVNSKRM